MAYTTRFGKPNMANLPPKRGKAIISQILNTPAPNRDMMHESSRNLEKEMVKIREKENAESKPPVELVVCTRPSRAYYRLASKGALNYSSIASYALQSASR